MTLKRYFGGEVEIPKKEWDLHVVRNGGSESNIFVGLDKEWRSLPQRKRLMLSPLIYDIV